MARYRVERVWRDGEPMRSHIMAEFDSPESAQNYQGVHGGHVVDTETECIWTPMSGWIDGTTGQEILSVPEAAAILGVSSERVRTLAADAGCRRIPGGWVLTGADVKIMRTRNTQRGPKPTQLYTCEISVSPDYTWSTQVKKSSPEKACKAAVLKWRKERSQDAAFSADPTVIVNGVEYWPSKYALPEHEHVWDW